ncbi:hypothetical protein Y1Q_0024280 [Alligator mississippiensis]|uniref:Uncharacterized protein n=1 Tax=Alligator mississippiensis TaxID=8496 RepID=A0A151NIC7_ALLMI|nr:hypothetical protein Y1Q_0024280 [Alligator mississippiensis]
MTSGIWALPGITSWGADCARSWDTLNKSTSGRGSPGIFFNVAALIDFITTQNINPAPVSDHLSTPGPEGYSLQGILIYRESGHIWYPPPSKVGV